MILEVNARPTGLRYAEKLTAQKKTGAASMAVPTHADLWQTPVAEKNIPDLLMRIISEDIVESPTALLSMIQDKDLYQQVWKNLEEYIMRDYEGQNDKKLLLKQERALLALADFIWMIKQQNEGHFDFMAWDPLYASLQKMVPDTMLRFKLMAVINDAGLINQVEGYRAFINPFLKLTNNEELMDQGKALEALERTLPDVDPSALTFQRPAGWDNAVHKSKGAMRMGISSANASDNWTNVKLRGGSVVNMAVNINGRVPIEVSVNLVEEEGLVLEIIGGLEGGPKQLKLNKDNIEEFFDYEKSDDAFRMLKYVLEFTKVVQADRHNSQDILKQINAFTGGKGLRIRVVSYGPSRSGFASSSSVAINLLNAVYRASGQTAMVEDPILLGSLSLLFENKLGLKSGRQDVDGPILPGVKEFNYRPTDGFVQPGKKDIEYIPFTDEQMKAFSENVLMVDTGIPRTAATDVRRGLNMRGLAFLSHSAENGYLAIEKSYGVHDKIVQALKDQNWAALGHYFLEYMALRAEIDPGAIWSKFDAEAREPVLRKFYDDLMAQGLIYGGMFSGAMGGGVAMLALTEKGKEVVNGRRRIDIALDRMKAYTTPATEENKQGLRPFNNLTVLDVSVNREGVQYSIDKEATMPSFQNAVALHEVDTARLPESVTNAFQSMEDQDKKVLSLGVRSAEAEILFAQMNPERTILGTNIKEEGLNIARDQVEEAGLSGRITFVNQNMVEEMSGYSDNSFDYVYARLAFHYLTNDELSQALAEIRRVLKPGGKLYIVTKTGGENDGELAFAKNHPGFKKDPQRAPALDPETGLTRYGRPHFFERGTVVGEWEEVPGDDNGFI